QIYVAFLCQAEDGIRDFHVTGVQTCALPISKVEAKADTKAQLEVEARARSEDRVETEASVEVGAEAKVEKEVKAERHGEAGVWEIGRASCRERLWMGRSAGAVRTMGSGVGSR